MTAVVFEARALPEEFVARLRSARRPSVVIGPSGAGKISLVNRLLDSDPNMIGVQIPRTVDRIERTILELGAAAGNDTEQEVAAQLRRNLDDPTPALECLDEALAGRRLLVHDYDALLPGALPSELSELFVSSQRRLSSWLRGQRAVVLTSEASLPDQWSVEPIPLPREEEPPWKVVGERRRTNELWEAARRDSEIFRVALAYWRLTGAAPPAAPMDRESGFSEAVWEAAPESVRFNMALLACYGGVFPARLFEQLIKSVDCGDWALEYAQQALLIERSNHWYWLSPLWQARVLSLLDKRVEQSAHMCLGEFFAKISQSGPPTNPRWIQAAHRHFLSAGSLEDAKLYLPFGVGLLLDAGRSASRARQYGLAAEYYDTALQLDAQLRAETGQGIGARSRGYATHYYHYNRYEGGQQPIEQTEAGYQQSVEDYPENALFWSRLILARFYQDHWDRALDTYRHASKSVQWQPARERYLLGRTVTKLLMRPLDNAAVVIWGDTTLVYDPRAEEAFARLKQRAMDGWEAAVLRVPGLPETVFEWPIVIKFAELDRGFRCMLGAAGIMFDGRSMLAAMRGALEQLRAEVDQSLRGHADEFTEEQRKRKRLLLGLVDVVSSEIKGPAPELRWLIGKVVEHPKLGRVFQVGSGEEYELAPSVNVPDSPNGMYEATLRAGRGGVLTGPVIEIEPLFKDQEELDAASNELDQLLGEIYR